MPYQGPNDSKLPSYVKSKSEPIRKKWVSLFNQVYKTDGESKAMLMANTWLKKQGKRKEFVKRSVIVFDSVDRGFIKRSSDGEDYMTFVLSSTTPHRDGKVFTEEMLKTWAQTINSNPIVGDVDHGLYDQLLSSYLSDESGFPSLSTE